MTEAHDKNKMFREILADTGTGDELSKKCICCFEDADEEALLQCLAVQRNRLLDDIHCGQKRIDCLDFLIYKIKNMK